MKRWPGIVLSIMLAAEALQAPAIAAETGATAVEAVNEDAGVGHASKAAEDALQEHQEASGGQSGEAQGQTDAVEEQAGTGQDAEDAALGEEPENAVSEEELENPVSGTEAGQDADRQAREAQEQPEEEVIFEINGVPVQKSTPAMYDAELDTDWAESFTNKDDALDYVLDGMIARQEKIDIIVPESVYNQLDINNYRGLCEHNGEPHAGDYLWASLELMGTYYNMPFGEGKYLIEYSFTYKTSAAQEAEVDAEVARLVTVLGLKDDSKSDYEKVKAIHDYIVENVEYDYDSYYGYTSDYRETYAGYGAIVNHLAVCQGFAAMFYRLSIEAGIDARLIDSSEIGHAWNIVQLDGLYYLMDCTWDENTKLDNYFLRGKYDFEGHGNSDDQFHDAAFAERYPLSDYKYGFEVGSLGKTTRGDMFNLANNVKVTWKEVPGARYYKVYREGVTAPGESRADPVIVTTGLVGWDKDPGLTNGHAYRYRIVASLTGKGDSSGDSTLSYSKLMYRLKTVVIRSVKNTAHGKVTVKFDKTVSGDSYVLQYCERQDMVGAKTKVVLGAENNSYVIGGLKKGKTYYISIRVRKKVNGIDYYTTFGVAKKITITK